MNQNIKSEHTKYLRSSNQVLCLSIFTISTLTCLSNLSKLQIIDLSQIRRLKKNSQKSLQLQKRVISIQYDAKEIPKNFYLNSWYKGTSLKSNNASIDQFREHTASKSELVHLAIDGTDPAAINCRSTWLAPLMQDYFCYFILSKFSSSLFLLKKK